MIQTSMRVPVDMWRRAKVYAAEQGITVQAVIARAIQKYLGAHDAA